MRPAHEHDARTPSPTVLHGVSLTHPTRGRAVIELQPGLVSQGGSVSIDGGAPQPLHAGVQGMTIGADGPVWEPLP